MSRMWPVIARSAGHPAVGHCMGLQEDPSSSWPPAQHSVHVSMLQAALAHGQCGCCKALPAQDHRRVISGDGRYRPACGTMEWQALLGGPGSHGACRVCIRTNHDCHLLTRSVRGHPGLTA
mmetsp:Transcript_1356/g.2958  ORF Transcript_1356/g.2958 Transcript_1356/m.2958 type:complete len:121 (-) Transcript_1356:123-485(-)